MPAIPPYTFVIDIQNLAFFNFNMRTNSSDVFFYTQLLFQDLKTSTPTDRITNTRQRIRTQINTSEKISAAKFLFPTSIQACEEYS